MYPFLRAATALTRASLQPRLAPDDTSVIATLCWPWDADPFLELNNGRHLTLFDLGRFVYGARLGLLGVLRRNGWGLVVGGAVTRYRRRIRLFERFEIVTRCIARDEKWFYFEQTTRRNGKACSSAILRTAVVAGPSGTVPTQTVAEALGFPEWHGRMPDWVSQLWEVDDTRPWPPEGVLFAATMPQPQLSSSASQ